MGYDEHEFRKLHEDNWGAEAWRAPELEEGDELLYSECGRVVKKDTYGHGSTGIDYRSHYFRVVKTKHGGCHLLVKHGGGRERFRLEWSANRMTQFFEPLDSTERYLLMHLFYKLRSDAKAEARGETRREYETAFLNGRLKKRKQRGENAVSVWIERDSGIKIASTYR